MRFTLSKNIKKGQKIKTANGWRKIREITDKGAMIKEGLHEFGSTIYGWKTS